MHSAVSGRNRSFDISFCQDFIKQVLNVEFGVKTGIWDGPGVELDIRGDLFLGIQCMLVMARILVTTH